MKRITTTLMIWFLSMLALWANDYPKSLQLKTYQLKNGLTVYLNEDHSTSSVMGMVVVKGGSKRDPKDATGIAHYFEHIMFKGTDRIGTINYTEEKVYLDSIAQEYDLLGKTEDKKEREKIQLKINQLSIKAAEYAIPNEMDKVLAEMGGTGINAFTSNECIAYHNSFPSSQMEKWLEVYSHRFENPVFRLFQSELETVYEEKNMYADDLGTPFIEALMKEMFPKTPYGEQTIVGSAEHLKNPSLSKMKQYFETYYVPNNMALILTGDFQTEQVIPLIEKKFGRLQSKEIPPHSPIKTTPFEGRHFVKKRLMPIKIGVMGYHTVPKGHKDELALDVCSQILSNYSSTGLLDELVNENKLMMASMEGQYFEELGGHFIIMVPKLIGQSLQKTEKLVQGQLTKLKDGDFDEELLQAVKVSMIKDKEQNIENAKWRAYAIMELFLYNEKWEDVLQYAKEVNSITKEDIVKVANKYFGKDFLAFYSKMGFPKKDKVKKPAFKHLEPKNTEAHSEYAKELSERETTPLPPRFIEEGKDFQKGKLNENTTFYYVNNPINQIFSLRFKFHMGTLENPNVELAASILNNCGTLELPYTEFSKEMQKLGAEFYAFAQDNYLTLHLTGLDKNLAPTLDLMNNLISNPQFREKERIKLIRNQKLEQKWSRKDPYIEGQALQEYAQYKDRSSFLEVRNAKELKKLSIEDMLSMVRKALARNVDLHYVGTVGKKIFEETAQEKLNFITTLTNYDQWHCKKSENYTENMVYFLDDKKAIQSQISILVPSNQNDKKDELDRKAFNSYFSGDMYSLVFQEIREFRSLAYSAWGYFSLPENSSIPGCFIGEMSTQADKTIEALETFTGLIHEMPEKPKRMEIIRKKMKQSINSKRPSFRRISYKVPDWKRKGYTQDPNKSMYPQYDELNFEKVKHFYEKYMHGQPVVITVVGNSKQIDTEKLKQFGKLIKIKKSEIFN
ncbi:MAG: M16 family metallopeptidase [Marinifilaceae bacterium]